MFGRPKTQDAAKGPLTVDVSSPGPCRQHLKIAMAPEGIAPVRESVVQEFQRDATLSGFRKGKAPRQMVEQRYAGEIREESVRRLTRQVFEQVATERKLKPVGPFEVSKLEFDEAKGLALEADIEVEPEFALADYKTIRIAQPPIDVTAEEMDQALKQLQESAAQLVPAVEGQEKQKQVPSLDDEFAKDVGFESLEELRTHVEAKLREQKRAQQAQGLEQQLCDALLQQHQFDVPSSLVQRQTERLTRDFQMRLLMSGRSEEDAKKELEQYTEQLRTNAVRLVKLTFILNRIAEQESLEVTQDELVDRLWKLSKSWGKDPAEVQRWLDSKQLWPSVMSSIRQDKTVRFLLGLAAPEAAASSGHVTHSTRGA